MTYDLTGVRLSTHALDVMARRGLEVEDVADALRRPDVTEPDAVAEGRVRFVRGRLAVVVAGLHIGRPVVVTTLLRERDRWTDDDARRTFAAPA